MGQRGDSPTDKQEAAPESYREEEAMERATEYRNNREAYNEGHENGYEEGRRYGYEAGRRKGYEEGKNEGSPFPMSETIKWTAVIVVVFILAYVVLQIMGTVQTIFA